MKKFSILTLAFLVVGTFGLAQANTYKVNKDMSKVEWKGEKKIVDSNHFGTIDIQEGKIEWKDGQIASGEFTVDMTSISSTDLSGSKKENLDGHLKSADFFDVTKHPTATFKVTKVTKKAENEFEVTGDLTIKGKTNPNTFTVKTEMKDGKLHGKGMMTFDRAKYDVKYASESFFDIKALGDKVIKNEIELTLNIIAEK